MSPHAASAFLREVAALYRLSVLYPLENERVRAAAGRAADCCAASETTIRLSLMGSDIVLQSQAIAAASGPFNALVKAIRGSRFEAVRFEPWTSAADLVAWMEHLLRRREEPFRQGGIVAGYLDLSESPTRQAANAVQQFLALSRIQEALAALAGSQPEGITLAREIVGSIALGLTDRPDLFHPVRVLKGHDDYTFTHAMNVCALATAIGSAMGFSGGFLDALSLAALCHDVGKQQIPLAVLNWKGPLDAEARRVMDGHPVLGARMLMELIEREELSPIVPVVAFQHHIGLNRSGYPQMPVSSPLHPASQVVAVADVFDAMRTVRPYRPARSSAAACTVLLEDARAGKLQPACVATLVRLSGILRPGAEVVLHDERRATVLETTSDPLRPMVETEDHDQLNLATLGLPAIAEVCDPQPIVPTSGAVPAPCPL